MNILILGIFSIMVVSRGMMCYLGGAYFLVILIIKLKIGWTFNVFTEYRKVMSDCKVSGQPLWQTSTSSLALCSLQCWTDRRCLSISYKKSSGACVVLDKCPSDCNTLGTTETGWSFLIPNITICNAVVTGQKTGDYVGGTGGLAYSDAAVWVDKPITAIRFNCRTYVPLIQVKYGGTWAPSHGSAGWPASPTVQDVTYEFLPDEYVIRVLSSMLPYVNSVQIFTNKKTYPTCGVKSGTELDSRGIRLLYISGRAGLWLDAIQFHWAESFYEF